MAAANIDTRIKRMTTIGRKPITTPLWVKIAIALAVATLLTVIAVLMTWGGFEPAQGKPVFTGAILAIPLIVAAKYEWATGASIALAFVTYFSVGFLAVLFFTREKHLTQAE